MKKTSLLLLFSLLLWSIPALAQSDTDGDGVEDIVDLCPAEDASLFDADGDGCIDPFAHARHIEYWAVEDLPLTYVVHEGGAPFIDIEEVSYTPGDEIPELVAGIDLWSSVAGATMNANFAGTTADSTADGTDGINQITFRDPDFISLFGNTVIAVGLTTSFTEASTFNGRPVRPGQIVDADMLFNPTRAFSADTSTSAVEIRAVAVHEAGHLFGLNHSAIPAATMFPALPAGFDATTLEVDDQVLAFMSYPDPAAVPNTTSVSGRVSDGATGLPIPGAAVFALAPGTDQQIAVQYTLPDGTWQMAGLPPGGYDFFVTPLDGSAAVSGVVPGYINELVDSTAQTVFLADYYDDAEGTSEDPLARTTVQLLSGVPVEDIDVFTNADEAAPVVLDVTPDNGALAVDEGSVLLVKFSEAVDFPSVATATLRRFRVERMDLSGPVEIAGQLVAVGTKDVLVFTPADPLVFDATYMLTLDPGVEDRFGNATTTTFTSTFTVQSPPPLAATTVSPRVVVDNSIIVISGEGFDADVVSNNSVLVGGIPADVIDANPKSLVARIPAGLSVGVAQLEVSRPGQTPVGGLSVEFVRVVDTARATAVQSVPLSGLPKQVTVLPDVSWVLAATGSGLEAVVADGSSPAFGNSTVRNFPEGLDGIAFGPDRLRSYGVSRRSGSLYVIDTDDGGDPAFPGPGFLSPLLEIETGARPLGVAVDPTGREAWLTTSEGLIQIWDLDPLSETAFAQIGEIDIGALSLRADLAFGRTGERLYALGDESLYVIEAASRTLLSTVPVGSEPAGVVEAPQGNLVYVTDVDGGISVVPEGASAPSQVITAEGSLRGIAVGPTGGIGYVADRRDEEIVIIDLRESEASFRTVIGDIATGEDPVDVVVSPDGSGVFSVSQGSRSLDVFGIGFGPNIDSVSPKFVKPGDVISFGGDGFGLSDSSQVIPGFVTDVDFAGIVVGPSAGTSNRISFFNETGWARVPEGYSGGPIRVLSSAPPLSKSIPEPATSASNPAFVSVWTEAEIAATKGLMLESRSVEIVDPLASSVSTRIHVHPLGDYVVLDDGSAAWIVDIRDDSPTFLEIIHTIAIPVSRPDDPLGSFGAERAFTPDGKLLYTHNLQVLNYFDADLASPTFGDLLGTVDFSLVDPTGVLFTSGFLRDLSISPKGDLLFVGSADALSTIVVPLTGPDANIANGFLNTGGLFSFGKFHYHPSGNWAFAVAEGEVAIIDLDPFSTNYLSVITTFAPPSFETVEDIALRKDGTGFWLLEREGGLGGQWNIWVGEFIDDPSDYTFTVAQTVEISSPTGQASLLLHPNGRRGMVIIPERRVAYVDFDQTFDAPELQVEPFQFVNDITSLGLFAFDGAWSPDGRRFFGVEQTDSVLRTFDYAVTFGTGLLTVSGASQTGVVGQTLPVPVRVRAALESGQGIPNAVIRVLVTEGGGTIDGGLTERLFVADGNGEVAVNLTLGPNPGANLLRFENASGSGTFVAATGVVDPLSIPLEVSQVLPLNGTPNVSATSAVQAVFSRAVNRATVSPSSFLVRNTATGQPVAAFLGFSDGDRRVSLIPTSPLAFETTFEFEIPASIEDVEGGALAVASTATFTTQAAPAPVLGGITPPAGTVGTTVVVSGEGFDGNLAANTVTLNGTPVTLESASVNSLRFTVPGGASSGPLEVAVNGTSAGGAEFTVLVPSAAAVDEIDDSVDLGVAAQALAVLPNGLKGYAVSTTSDQVIPIDLITLENGVPVTVGTEPVGAVSDVNGEFVYVANRGSNSVSVVDTATDAVVTTILLDASPEEIVAGPNGAAIYVVTPSGQAVVVIDVDATSATYNTATASLATGQSTRGASVSPDGTLLFLGTEDGFLSIGLTVSDFGATVRVATGQSTRGTSISPDGTVLILLTESDEILLVDVDGPGFGTVTARLSAGQSTRGASISPDGSVLYVIGEDTDEILAFAINVVGSVSVLEGIPLYELQLIAIIDAGDDPRFIAFDPRDPTVAFVGATGDLAINVFGRVGTPVVDPGTCESFEVVFGTPWDGDPTLQEVFDAEYGVGAIDAATDYEGYRCDAAAVPYWLDDSVDGWIIRELGDAANFNTLGWYAEDLTGPPVIDGVDDGVIFAGFDGEGSTSYVGLPGATRFGLYMNPQGDRDAPNAPEPELFYTNRRYNDIGPDGSGAIHAPDDGDPQALIYDITALRGGVPTYVIAWEDVDSGSEISPTYEPFKTDNDYNDLIVEVRASSPVSAVVSSVSATQVDDHVRVEWDVTGASLVRSVAVERRLDDGGFETVAQIAEARESGQWIDTTLVESGRVGYRVAVDVGVGVIRSEVTRVDFAPSIPREARLFDAVPNPFNPATRIAWTLPKAQRARLEIFDVRGRLVVAPFDEMKSAGAGSFVWNGTDQSGQRVSSGVFLYRLTTEGYVQTKRMVLLK